MRAEKKDDKALLQVLLRKDEGRAFFDYLNTEVSRGRPPMFKYHNNSKWFVSFQYVLAISDLGGVRLTDGGVANPGPFHGEVDYLQDSLPLGRFGGTSSPAFFYPKFLLISS
jgi:hypothetical protein